MWMPTGQELSVGTCVLLMGVLAISAMLSGLAGFGFSAIGASALWILPPTQAVPLLMLLSTANQSLAIFALRDDMPRWRDWWPDGPAPYVIGGLLGVRLGLWMLVSLPATAVMLVLGAVLIGYTAWAFFSRAVPATQNASAPSAPSGWRWPVLVGMVGGTIGGFSAFPGAAVVMWAGLRRIPKLQLRAIVQPYILAMQVVALAMLAWSKPQIFDRHFMTLLILTLPVVLPLTTVGVRLFRRTSEGNFRLTVLLLVGISGAGLIGRGLVSLA